MKNDERHLWHLRRHAALQRYGTSLLPREWIRQHGLETYIKSLTNDVDRNVGTRDFTRLQAMLIAAKSLRSPHPRIDLRDVKP